MWILSINENLRTVVPLVIRLSADAYFVRTARRALVLVLAAAPGSTRSFAQDLTTSSIMHFFNMRP